MLKFCVCLPSCFVCIRIQAGSGHSVQPILFPFQRQDNGSFLFSLSSHCFACTPNLQTGGVPIYWLYFCSLCRANNPCGLDDRSVTVWIFTPKRSRFRVPVDILPFSQSEAARKRPAELRLLLLLSCRAGRPPPLSWVGCGSPVKYSPTRRALP